VFSSLLKECCTNDIFCSDLLICHKVSDDCDSRDVWQDAMLKHLLNGKCASVLSPLCQLLAYNSASAPHLSYMFCMMLLGVRRDGAVGLETFSLCCASVCLDAATSKPQRELKNKLEQRLKL